MGFVMMLSIQLMKGWAIDRFGGLDRPFTLLILIGTGVIVYSLLLFPYTAQNRV